MAKETPPPAAQTSDEGVPAPRTFPVPRNRPVLTSLEETARSAPPAWLVITALAVVVLALAASAWLAMQPRDENVVPALAEPEPRRVTDDPAVEIYFTPSQPESLPPLEEDATPLPVAPVSLDELFGKD